MLSPCKARGILFKILSFYCIIKKSRSDEIDRTCVEAKGRSSWGATPPQAKPLAKQQLQIEWLLKSPQKLPHTRPQRRRSATVLLWVQAISSHIFNSPTPLSPPLQGDEISRPCKVEKPRACGFECHVVTEGFLPCKADKAKAMGIRLRVSRSNKWL